MYNDVLRNPDRSLSLCQITSRIGDIQVFFKLYSKSGLIIYQSQATVTTDTKKSEICLRVEDTTPACDYLVSDGSRVVSLTTSTGKMRLTRFLRQIPEKSAGAVTGKVFVTTTSVETPAVERNYRYESEAQLMITAHISMLCFCTYYSEMSFCLDPSQLTGAEGDYLLAI